MFLQVVYILLCWTEQNKTLVREHSQVPFTWLHSRTLAVGALSIRNFSKQASSDFCGIKTSFNNCFSIKDHWWVALLSLNSMQFWSRTHKSPKEGVSRVWVLFLFIRPCSVVLWRLLCSHYKCPNAGPQYCGPASASKHRNTTCIQLFTDNTEIIQ